jgi:8-oxo-dGTP pyrophosphatase MutT (NUDIX family)
MTERPLRATVSQKAVLFGPEGEVLLLRDGHGNWEFPGGRIDRRESPEEGLKREVREETGLDPEVGRPVHTTSWLNDRDEGRFAVVYRCRTNGREVTLSHEHDDWKWVTADAVERHLNDVQCRAVERARSARGVTSASDGTSSPPTAADHDR